jgi:RsiW-degrading membrane proteinase PrsW (M82 family)
MRALLRLVCSCVIGLAIWLPLAHFFFEPDRAALHGKAGANGTLAQALAAGMVEE